MLKKWVYLFGEVKQAEQYAEARKKAGVKTDAQLTADHWKSLTGQFKVIFKHHTNQAFPTDPYTQLKMAIQAVFKSWNGKRAIDYRNAAGISHDLGTAVTIMTIFKATCLYHRNGIIVKNSFPSTTFRTSSPTIFTQ